MDTPVSNPPTLDDAQRALNELLTSADLSDPTPAAAFEIIHTFIDDLTKRAAPEGVIATDHDGFILEGAMQNGFETIDDNADLYVVHANDLIKYVTTQRDRGAHTALQNAAREALPPVVLSIQDEIELGKLVLEFGNTPLFGEGRLRKDVMLDLKKLFGISQAARAGRYSVIDNVDGQPSGYVLVDNHAARSVAAGLREEHAVTIAYYLNGGKP